METRIRKIGNSSGILLSKNILNECEIFDEVTVEVKNKSIIIKPKEKQPRAGWEQQFLEAGSLEDAENILGEQPTDFETNDWKW